MSKQISGVVSAAGSPPAEHSNVKDTVISVLISLVLAFVFRGFVVEAFQIPTGSMGPTLLGAHMRFRSPVTGTEWPVQPWEYLDASYDNPRPEQKFGPQGVPIVVHDPMSNYELTPSSMKTISGDRIFVLKYLYSIFDPSRFDVVVFKNPQKPQENFIKRLIGLPNEQIALVDGDVFVRPASAANDESLDSWSQPGWTIARKPELVQRAVWQPVFDSTYTPRSDTVQNTRWFFPPWKASTGGWQIENRPDYVYTESAPTRLDWDLDRWPLIDRYSYNEAWLRMPHGPSQVLLGGWWRPTYEFIGPIFYYPVSDLRVAAGIEPGSENLEAAINLVARGHQFQARLGKNTVSINMRPQPASEGADEPWKQLATTPVEGLFEKDRITNVEFWHADQSCQVWIDGELVLEASYDWSPAQRIQNTLGLTMQQIADSATASNKSGVLIDGTKYRLPGLSMAFDGSPVTLHRVGVWRDLHYQATNKALLQGPSGLAVTPQTVLTTGPDHFFCCGDNSPASHDGRAWNSVETWVAHEIDPTIGVVHRDLLIGKAFFVYFPGIQHSGRSLMFDVGRMRLIW
ncbi:MAG: hypothetical protein GIKADHBN_01869 [Phycisphaerales bacterium]|nr:hypothetical protein [Phycisphaerales bacterium]